MKKAVVILLLAIVPLPVTLCQDNRKLQEKFLEAEYYFFNEEYLDALPVYLQLFEKMRDNSNLAYRIGVCYLNIPGSKNLAVSYLEAAVRNMLSKRKEGRVTMPYAPYDALYQLGLAYRINQEFDKAGESLKRYRSSLLPDDKENIEFIDHEIRVCENAKKMIASPVDFRIENLGNSVNDERYNYAAVISGDGKSLVFITSFPFYKALMYTRLENGKWTTPENITGDLQSDGDLLACSLSYDGKTLYLSRDDDYNSDLLVSSLEGKKWSTPVALNNNINTEYWESHGSVSEDGTYMVFASDRPGGYGGLDIYISHKDGGDWGPAENLGPDINSPFNEDWPSVVKNLKMLFFASQGHEGIGGYDLFSSEKMSNGLWSKPRNLGYPLNTPDDNIYFAPADNGSGGIISIYRESEGYGREDIWRITFK